LSLDFSAVNSGAEISDRRSGTQSTEKARCTLYPSERLESRSVERRKARVNLSKKLTTRQEPLTGERENHIIWKQWRIWKLRRGGVLTHPF